MLLRKMSGHMYRGSAYETDSDCGNCDGARCECCNVYYSWYGYESKWFDTEEEARTYGKEQEQLRADLVPGVKVSNLTNAMWILVEEELYCYYYDFDEGSLGQYKTVKCNPNSPLYYNLWSKAVDRAYKYDRCTIPDKGKEYHISYCQMFGQCSGYNCKKMYDMGM